VRHKGPPIRPNYGLILLLAALQSSCDGVSGGNIGQGPTEPPGSSFLVIVHTKDGRHLEFAAASFRPSSIEHCREDGQQHLTPIYELAELWPAGRGYRSMCPQFSGRYMRLHLVFLDQPALKVTTLCEEYCEEPGGYYQPLGMNVGIPWSNIFYIEFKRD